MCADTPTQTKTTAKAAPGTPAGDGVPPEVIEAKRLYERAMAHHRAGRLEDAVSDYARVIALSPMSADVYNNLGVALRASGHAHAAIACFRRSLAMKPGAAGTYTNLGNALRDLGECGRAVEAHRRAVKLAPKSPSTLMNAGLALRDVGEGKAALEHFSRATQLEPTYARCRVEHAYTLLQMGDWKRGFKELEIRFALPGHDPRRKGIQPWNGSTLQGKTILINFESGPGTLVQFARFAPTLKHMGAKVVMECPGYMAHLLAAIPDVDATVPVGQPLPADVKPDAQVPLLSLPARLGVDVDTLPAESAYLSVPKFGGASLNIHAETRLAVGLVWSSAWNGRAVNGPGRLADMKLEDFDEILGIPGLQIFSLERGPGASDIARLGLRTMIEPVGTTVNDAADLVGLIDQLDLIIGADSLTAHIAGALGKPVWVMTGPGGDWSWLTDRADTPWYPSMRLFRRQPNEKWPDTTSQIRKALTDIMKGGA